MRNSRCLDNSLEELEDGLSMGAFLISGFVLKFGGLEVMANVLKSYKLKLIVSAGQMFQSADLNFSNSETILTNSLIKNIACFTSR